MQDAVLTTPSFDPVQPDGVVTCKVDPKTGLAPGLMGDAGAIDSLCLRRARPPREQPWRKGASDKLP